VDALRYRYGCVLDMATLTIKNLPDEIYAALGATAKRNRRSINKEAILRLEQSLEPPKRELETEALVRIREHRENLARKGVFLTDEILNEGRRHRY
jgi:plasmid stability protein